MWDWIITYWVQVFFGLIAAGFGLLAKKFWTMYQHEKEHDVEANMAKCYEKVRLEIENVENLVAQQDKDFAAKLNSAYNSARDHDKTLEENLQSISTYIDTLKDGVLSIQGAHFRQQCKAILASNRIISIDEFEQLTYDHKIYNKLGGNHLGDSLFAAVEAKFQAQALTTKK